jgi:hypothetical protein
MSDMTSAQWIWYGDFGYDLVNAWMQARRSFTLKTVPAKAVIGVTADTQYRLYVNGVHLMRGPARGFQASWPYDTVDIAPYLRKGRNVIAVLVHQSGISTFQYLHEGHSGLLLWGRVEREDISSGKAWRVRPAPGYRRVTTRVSLQLGFQESFDARLDDESWLTPEYDDSDWIAPRTRNLGCMPWHGLEDRGIPPLREEVRFPKGVISTSSGKCAQGYADAADVVSLYASEKHSWRSAASMEFPPTGKDRFIAYCVDFGKEVVGSLRIVVEGAKGGEIVDTLVTEGLYGIEPGIFDPSKKECHESFGNRLVARAGRTEHEQFDYWGFRYAVVVVRNSAKKLKIGLKLHWVGYPLELKGEFETSNKRLNDIYEMCVWTQQCCMLDAYVDCPWREQAQWWGDARVQGANTFYLSADSRLMARGIRQIAGQDVPNGLTYGHAPTMAHGCILPDFTLTWILTHRDYYWQTGDLSLFEAHKARIHRAFEYFQSMLAPNGLFPYDPRYWLFLDWCPIFKDGYPTLYNFFYLAALRAAIELFRLSGEEPHEYVRREEALADAIEKRLFRNGAIVGGLSWEGKPVAQNSAHVYAWAILLDLFPAYHQSFLERQLLPVARGNHKDPLTPSPFFMTYIFDALKKCGRMDEAVDCIERWWGEMLDRGFTTAVEVWSSRPAYGSLCHAWSAHPIVHFSNILLGIWQESPAWQTIRFSPTFTRADRARGKVATPHGAIESSWEKVGDSIRVTLDLPPGVTAIASLPGHTKESVTGRKEWVLVRHTRRMRAAKAARA